MRAECACSEPPAAPSFTPEGGSYGSALDVTLRTDTDGAGIRYTVDGSTPSAIHGRAYDGFPISVSSSVTIRAVACRCGCPDSPVSAVTYTLAGTAETPTFSPDAGSGPFDTEVRVTMSTGTAGAGVCYTTDGSDPRPADGYGTPYLGVPVRIDATTTLKAVAWKPGVTPVHDRGGVLRHRRAHGDRLGKATSAGTRASRTPTGALLIAYRDDTAGALKLARSTDGGLTWSTRFLDWQGDPGVPRLHRGVGRAWSRSPTRRPAPPTCGARSPRIPARRWHRYPVDATGTTDCQYTSTAIRGPGEIFIAYHEAVSADLKLAYSTEPGATWTVRGLETSANVVGQYAAVA